MPSKGPIDPQPKPSWRLRLFRGRLFRWGISFWVVLWMLSVMVSQSLIVNLKDCHGMKFGFGAGTVGIRFNTYGTVVSNHIQWDDPLFLWSKWALSHLHQYPGDFIGLLGNVGWSEYGYDHSLHFPIIGFLLLWLIGGWIGDFKTLRWTEFRKNRCMIKRATILISLPLIILLTDRRWRLTMESTDCILNIRNIQQTIRGYQGMRQWNTGDPIPWDNLFHEPGLETYMKECPSGGNYQLIPTVPDSGVIAAKCPNPEHLRRLKDQGTSGW